MGLEELKARVHALVEEEPSELILRFDIHRLSGAVPPEMDESGEVRVAIQQCRAGNPILLEHIVAELDAYYRYVNCFVG